MKFSSTESGEVVTERTAFPRASANPAGEMLHLITSFRGHGFFTALSSGADKDPDTLPMHVHGIYG